MPVTAAAERTLTARLAPLPPLIQRVDRGRTPSPAAIHNLRVGCRRAGAALLLYRELLTSGAGDWWRRRLRKLRRAAGPIRTLDVLLRRLNEHQPDSPLIALWSAERRARLDSFRRQLSKFPQEERLVARQQELLSCIRWTVDGEEPTFGGWAAVPLAAAVEEFFSAEPDDRGCFTSLHTFRVGGKRLRYTLELLGAALGPRAADAASVLEEFQSRLGRIQDRYDACRRLGDVLRDLQAVDELHSTVELLQTETATVQQELSEFWKFWKSSRALIRRLHRSR